MKPHAIRHTHRPLPTHHVTITDAGDGGDDDMRWRKPVLIHSSYSWMAAAAELIDWLFLDLLTVSVTIFAEWFHSFHSLHLILPPFICREARCKEAHIVVVVVISGSSARWKRCIVIFWFLGRQREISPSDWAQLSRSQWQNPQTESSQINSGLNCSLSIN